MCESTVGGTRSGGDGDSDDNGDGDGDADDGDGDGGIKFDVGEGIMGEAGGACDEVTVTGEPEPPNIMLILDRSCSMAGQRWTDLQTVVTSLVTNYDAEVNFGAQFYPQVVGPDDCSSVTLDVPVAPMNGATITNLINGNGPTGLTPTLPAVQTSVTHLQGLMSEGDKVQILIADGDVNECGTATDVESALSAAYNGGVDLSIPTYAVSVGGTLTQLQNFAVAGGTGNYIETSDLSSLNAAIDAIVEGVLSCKIALDPPPDYPEEVEVSVGGMVYPQLANAAACGDGWYYTTPAKDELELCGAACDQLKITFQADIAYKCPQN
ncbi:MAG: vWA domain-containing protein [Nannocystaceae bacterium]